VKIRDILIYSGFAVALSGASSFAASKATPKMIDFDRPDFSASSADAGAKPVDKAELLDVEVTPIEEKKDAPKTDAAPAPASSAQDAKSKEALARKLDGATKGADEKYKNQYLGRLYASQPELSADAMDYPQTENGVLVARGNAKIADKNFEIEADTIEYSQKNGVAVAKGDVRITQDAGRIVANNITVDVKNSAMSSQKILFGTFPLYAESADVKGDKEVISAGKTSIYFNEPDIFSLSANASSMKYTASEDYLELEDVTVKVGPVPVMYVPYYAQHGLDKPPLIIKNGVGYNESYGAFIRNTIYYSGLDDFSPGILMDYYTKRSFLVGPALKYDFSSSFTDAVGSFQSAYIDDHGSASELGVNDLGQAIDNNRYFMDLEHTQSLGENARLTGVMNYWSDQFVTRDFRPAQFYDNQIPDNFVEASYYGSFYTASVFGRFQPNNWEIVQQRLPEVRFDMQNNDPLGIKLYQRGYAAVGYYNENAVTSVYTPVTSTRADAYYGWERPIQLNSWSTFTPVVGSRVTYYERTVNSSGDYTRILGQLGFDAQMDVWGVFDAKSETLGIDGIRHNLRPIMQYRYIPAASQGRDKIPQIDELYFTSYPPILDLGTMRNTDYMNDLNTMRLGVENVFQTRDSENYGSREIARLDFYQDFNFKEQAYITPNFTTGNVITTTPETAYSNFYVHGSVSPSRWMTLGAYTRVDVENIGLPELNTYLKMYDSEYASITLFNCYLEDQLTQYGAEAEYKITQNYSVKGRWNYDYRLQELTNQLYSLVTRLGNSWLIEYQVGYREGSTRENNFYFGARVELVTY